MKKKDLERIANQSGWWLKRHGADHDIWTNGSMSEPIPRLGRLRVMVDECEDNIIGIRATDNKFLYALALRRQREKNGSTVRDAARRLHARSPNAYAQYEQARVLPSMQHYQALLMAANPSLSHPRLHFG